ncbi:MAG: hypothetical protein QM831_11650 [Kofleriaceae bacterium]
MPTEDRKYADDLFRKLGREFLQAERDCRLHTRREARRQGRGAPADALLSIAAHADQVEPRIEQLLGNASVGVLAARFVAHSFSDLRYGLVDRLMQRERTYRATLLGIRHGLDAGYLLTELALRSQFATSHAFLEEALEVRARMLAVAVQALAWFAEHPRRAAQRS